MFWKALLKSFFDAALAFYIPFYATFYKATESVDGLYTVGRISYLAIQFVVTLEVCAISRHFTTLFVAFVAYSTIIIFPFFYLFEESMQVRDLLSLSPSSPLPLLSPLITY